MSIWQKIVVEGSEKTLRAFVAGFESGRGSAERVLLGCDLEIEHHTMGERLRELFDAGSHHTLLAHPHLAVEVAEALQRRGVEIGLSVHSRHELASANFRVAAEAYAPEMAARIKDQLLESLPEGVTVTEQQEDEKRDPEAHGAEMYAPVHEYTYTLHATFSGSFPAVLEMHRRASHLEFVKADRVNLVTQELTE